MKEAGDNAAPQIKRHWVVRLLLIIGKGLGVLAILGLATWGVLTLLKEEEFDLKKGKTATVYLVARAGSSSYGENITGEVQRVDRRGVTMWGVDPFTGSKVGDYMLIPWDSIYYVQVKDW